MRPLMLGLALLWALLPAAAWARPVLVWAIVEGPPEHERPEARRIEALGQGPMDQTLRMLAAQLPDVEHRVEAMSLEKVWRDMRLGRPVCFADAFKTNERLKVARFVELSPSLRMLLVALPGRLPAGPELSLRELLVAGELRGLFGRQRSYGDELDRVLDEFQPRRESMPPDAKLLPMLQQGRMDYLLENANGWLQTQPGQLDLRLVREGRQTPPVHVACGRSVGQDLLLQIDAAVRQLSRQDAWLQLKVLSYPPGAREEQRLQLQQYLRQRAERTAISD